MTRWLLGICLILSLSFGVSPLVLGQNVNNSNLIEMSVSAGFGGVFREGMWLPLRVRVRNDGPPVTGRLIVRPETSGRVVSNAYSAPIDLPTGSDKIAFLYIQARGLNAQIQVELLADDNVLVTRQPVNLFGINPQDRLYASITGPTGQHISFSGANIGGFSSYQALWDLADIPENGLALTAIDMMVFNDVDTGGLTAGQRRAITDWVINGGHLVVTGGPNWEATADGFGDLLPFMPTGTRRISNLAPVAHFVGDAQALTGETIIAVGSIRDLATVPIHVDTDTPLLVRRRYGEGVVDYFAADPMLAPLREWGRLPEFWLMLLNTTGLRPAWSDGFNDMVQAAIAISTLPGVDVLPPTQLLCGFLIAYIVLIGPVNYFILSRINRREWAWGTIPFFIILFSVISWTVGFNLRGAEVTLSNVSVVESWPDAEQARVRQLVGLLSPRRASYSLSTTDSRMLQVLPPLNQLTSLSFQAEAEIVQTSVFRAADFPIDGGIFANFATVGMTTRPDISGRLTWVSGPENTLQLQGSVRNDSTITLTEVVLLARGVAYHLPTPLTPGGIVTFDGDDLTIAPTVSAITPSSYLEYSPDNFFRPITSSFLNTEQTIADIMGENYRTRRPPSEINLSLDEKEARRRQALLAAFMRDQNGSTARGDNVYLVGWSNQAPLDFEVFGAPWTTSALTLYIIQLEVTRAPIVGEVILYPDQFTWLARERRDVPEDDLPDILLLPGSDMTVRFTPLPNWVLDTVSALTILLDRNTGFTQSLHIYIWDWSANAWEELRFEGGRPRTFDNPIRYLGPNNIVDIRLSFDEGLGSARIRNLRITQLGTFDAR